MARKRRLPPKLQPWAEARKRHHLSHAHVQMARELGMNPKKLGKLDNHDQEAWKMPLPRYLEHLYRKRFGRARPLVVRRVEEIQQIAAAKRATKKIARASRAEAKEPQGLCDPDSSSTTVRVVRVEAISIRAEIDYIVEQAARMRTKIVRLGPLVFFSTATQDAWLLDPADRCALPLLRAGDRLPVRIFETGTQFTIEWTHDYRIDGEAFCVVERTTGSIRVIIGYPTAQIADA